MLEKSWTISRVWKNEIAIELVEFSIDFTDTAFPGLSSSHAGVIPLQDLDGTATRQEIIDAILGAYGSQMSQLEAFHFDQLSLRYVQQESTAVVIDAKPIRPADVNQEHDRRALIGKTFTVTGYGPIPLEGSLKTQAVLLALKDTARDLFEANVTEPLLFFTDRENGDHNLTAAQVIELVNAGKNFMQELHEAKRELKVMNPIPADYTDDTYWPVGD